jgi:hypothetical protein
MKRSSLQFLVSLLLLSLHCNGAQLLNIDFGSVLPDVPRKVGKAGFGLTDQDYWNVIRSGILTNLLWSDGSSSSMSLSLSNSGGLWGSGAADSMMQTYLYTGEPGFQIHVSGIEPGIYDLYFYAHGEPPAENGVIEVMTSDKDYGTKSTTNSPDWKEVLWTEGAQYVRFESLEIVGDGILNIASKPGASKNAVINGMQLLPSGPSHPRRATAIAELVNGFVVNLKITDRGSGYTEPPQVLILGDGEGATATATITDGEITGLTVTSAGRGYTTAPQIVIASPVIDVHLQIRVSRVAVDLTVGLGKKYLLESSNDFKTWTAVGDPFLAQSETLTQEFIVAETGNFFRLREVR